MLMVGIPEVGNFGSLLVCNMVFIFLPDGTNVYS